MSADNGIYILRSKAEYSIHEIMRTTAPEHYVYRVAHNQAMDNYEWYLSNQVHNLGWYLWGVFKDSYKHLSYDSALLQATALERGHGYTEYGICLIEFDKVFPGD